MKPIRKIAFIGNSLPRRCGIATFTTDLQMAVQASSPDIATCIVAMTDAGQVYAYPPSVAFQIHDDTPQDYIRAADFLNSGGFECVCLQHEFGIFGGEAGADLLALLARLTMPIVTTLHTVLTDPTPAQRAVLIAVVARSMKIIVMAQKARLLLQEVYGVDPRSIEVIPHGIPDVAFAQPAIAKRTLGFAGRSVVLTFGLLSPNKGIETMIEAMPSILQRCPDAIYVVLGATHPNLVRDHGEAYRESLVARAQTLGIAKSVVFLDQFVEQPELLEFISSCDVYVTPYLDAAQMTSGTLAYSFGSGRPVVSTPYWHARELLAEGRGVLVPFGDAAATGQAVGDLLTDDVRRQAMAKRAYTASRAMIWLRTAEAYMAVFSAKRRAMTGVLVALPGKPAPADGVLPAMQLGHLNAMCDDTGLYQHAVHTVPDRAHGYCVDDNARALLLACALNAPGEQRLPDVMTSRFAAFVQHAWNPDNKRFRNFMGFNRTWLEDVGSEDSHGRTLWALGECVRSDNTLGRRRWAAALFAEAIASVDLMTSPRAWAFALLGLDAYCEATPQDQDTRSIRRRLADRLMSRLADATGEDWRWFEDGLSYDNARLPQALILTGLAMKSNSYVAAGVESLRWLMTQQRAPGGHFRPVGSAGFGSLRQSPAIFDQQPVEAAATIAAYRAAHRIEANAEWLGAAATALEWFLGRNDLSIPLVDLQSGSCRDGLHPDRANENCGGESVVSYLLALADMRAMLRARPAIPHTSELRAAGA
jgi:glycosyltransferase involved in cell wall biosynthesis